MFRQLATKLAQHNHEHIYIRGFQSIMATSMVVGVSVQTYDALCVATNQHKYIICKSKPAVVAIPLITFVFALAWPFVVVGVPIGGSMYAIRRLVYRQPC